MPPDFIEFGPPSPSFGYVVSFLPPSQQTDETVQHVRSTSMMGAARAYASSHPRGGDSPVIVYATDTRGHSRRIELILFIDAKVVRALSLSADE